MVDELSTGRVLTTDLADGARFAEVERWPQAQRDLAARSTWEAVASRTATALDALEASLPSGAWRAPTLPPRLALVGPTGAGKSLL